MERTSPNSRRSAAWWLLALALLPPATGCTSALAAATYIIKGYQTDPEYKGLKGKHVVVVCRPPADDEYSNVRVPNEIARQLSLLLGERVSKIKVVDYREVARWTDENDWTDEAEVGKALNADTVVAIDLERFSIFQGQTLYQGQALCHVRVIDLTAGNEIVFDKHMPPSVYPPNTGVPISEREEEQFRREYVSMLSDEIGRLFYPYDALDDMSRDTDAVLR